MTRYTIERRDGLLIVQGALPLDDLDALTSTMPSSAIFCTLLPARLGANLVAGPVDAINAERERQGIAERVKRWPNPAPARPVRAE